MRKIDPELAAGLFLLLGIIAFGYISLKLGKLDVMGQAGYNLYAEFGDVGGIKPGAVVEIAGVPAGTIKSIRLDNYQALVELAMNRGVKIQEDAIASIKTKGLIGEKYVQITPGASDKMLADGGRIRETESVIDIESLISKYVFGKV